MKRKAICPKLDIGSAVAKAVGKLLFFSPNARYARAVKRAKKRKK